MRSPGAGGVDFASDPETTSPDTVLWTPHALPSVVTLTEEKSHRAEARFELPPISVDASLAADGPEHLVEIGGAVHRIHIDEPNTAPLVVLLPLDQFFEIRAAAAIRLFRSLTRRNPGPNPARLTKARRDRLILALRALDGRVEGMTYPAIAEVLFTTGKISGRARKTHDARDRTIRLAALGFDMMQGGYRHLLLHPYRRRL